MSWVPPDLSEVCPDTRAELAACSSAGYMFLSLVTQLFGNSLDSPQPGLQHQFQSSPYNGSRDIEGPPIYIPSSIRIPKYDYTHQGSSIHGPEFRIPSEIGVGPTGPVPSIGISSVQGIFQRPETTRPTNHQFSEVDDPETINTYSHGVGGSRGVSKTSFFRKKTQTSPEINFSFETKMFGGNPFAKKAKPIKYPFDLSIAKKNFNEPGGLETDVDHGYDNAKEAIASNFYRPQSFATGDHASASTIKKTETPLHQINYRQSGKRKKRQVQGEEYDFIVVGAGSSGCVVANRLSEVKSWKVLLLEAGDEEPEVASVPALASALGQSSIDWRYRTQPEQLTCTAQRGRTCAWLRGKVMGGSSTINYMIYMRGNKRDYDEWAEAGNHGWSFNDVLPYFKKSENNRDLEGHDNRYHGVGGYLNVERFPFIDKNVVMIVDSFKEKGLPLTDFNGEQQIGTMTTQTTSLDGRRFSANVAFIRPIRYKRPNLIIKTQSEVTKVLIDPKTKTAFGVKYFRQGEWHFAYARKEVILSAGALNSPKILMLSGIGPSTHLHALNIEVASDLKVGYNLQDHVTTDALVFSVSNKTSTMISPNQLPGELSYYYNAKKKDGPLAATGPLYASAFIQTEYSAEGPDIPDIQYHFDGRNIPEFYADTTNYLAANIFPLAFYNGLAARPILLKPKSRGFLTLNITDPVFGQPLIYPRFFTSKVDVDTMIAAMRFVISLEETQPFRISGASYVRYPVEACAGYPWGTQEYLTCLLTSYTSTIFHPVGTCKMGPHWDRDAVVDPRLKVNGVKNLRVADASIMPTIVRGNTNAVCIMIGEKASDMIKSDWITQ